MMLLRSIDSARLPAAGCALTIGNFDGVHLGHRRILETLVAEGRRRGLPTMVMTFDPHPGEYFGARGTRLTPIATRYLALRECAIDGMLVLRFNRALAHTPAETFIRHHLVARLRVRYLLVGDDFRFGARRAGDFAMLARMAPRHGYEVARIDTVSSGRERIGSTRIRELLGAGELPAAAQLLGRRYALSGRVIHGEKRGRRLGFPTLNLAIHHRAALGGVFAVNVTGLAPQPLAGVASLGCRPAVGGGTPLLEVHLFDYHGDAYGRRVCVEFVERIRGEENFPDYESLVQQMRHDTAAAKEILARADP